MSVVLENWKWLTHVLVLDGDIIVCPHLDSSCINPNAYKYFRVGIGTCIKGGRIKKWGHTNCCRLHSVWFKEDNKALFGLRITVWLEVIIDCAKSVQDKAKVRVSFQKSMSCKTIWISECCSVTPFKIVLHPKQCVGIFSHLCNFLSPCRMLIHMTLCFRLGSGKQGVAELGSFVLQRWRSVPAGMEDSPFIFVLFEVQAQWLKLGLRLGIVCLLYRKWDLPTSVTDNLIFFGISEELDIAGGVWKLI